MAAHSVFLPGESQGQGSLVGCRLWGHTELDTTEAAAAASLHKIPSKAIYAYVTHETKQRAEEQERRRVKTSVPSM